MQDVIYPGPHEAVQSHDGQVFVKGEPVKVKDSVAESLFTQGFEAAKPKPSNDKNDEGK